MARIFSGSFGDDGANEFWPVGVTPISEYQRRVTVTERVVNNCIAIFDLDGCVSNDVWRRGRIPLDAKVSADYDDYHSACSDDPPLEQGAKVLHEHIKNGDFIIFATARPFSRAVESAKWISRHFGIEASKDFIIMMRKANDDRSALDVKLEMAGWVREYRKQTGKIVLATYDDRLDIAKMWKAEGYASWVLDQGGLVSLDPAALTVEGPVSVGEGQGITIEGVREAAPDEKQKTPDYSNGLRLVEMTRAEIEEFMKTTPEQDAAARRFFGLDVAEGPDKTVQINVSAGTTGEAEAERAYHENIEIRVGEKGAPLFRDAADILEKMAETFRERNAQYKDNAIMVGEVMAALFPHGVTITDPNDHHVYHLFELLVVKLTRFVKSGLTHTDSIHDAAVYAAMIENIADIHDIEVH